MSANLHQISFNNCNTEYILIIFLFYVKNIDIFFINLVELKKKLTKKNQNDL